MKKSLIALSTVFLLSIGVATAQVQQKDNVKAKTEQVQKQVKQVEISTEKLPAAIQKTLETEKFADWKISKAYKVDVKSANPEYKVVLTNGEKKAEYTFDKNGKIVS